MRATGWISFGLGLAAIACDHNRPPSDMPEPSPGEVFPAPSDTMTLAVVPIDDVLRSAYTGIQDRRRLVIRTQAEWEAFWRELVSNQLPPPPVPPIDFDRRMVIATSMGSRPTGGYAIEIERVAWADGELTVSVLEVSPGPGCILTQAFTAPVAAVTVERREGEAAFVERTETRDC